jgi:RND family efflux transporter MFP subunit
MTSDTMSKKDNKKDNSDKKTPFWKRKWLWVVIIVLVIGGGLWLKNRSSANQDLDSVIVEKGSVRQEIILTGKIRAIEHAQLNFQSSGELSWIGVKEGDWVKKGQYLARLNANSLQAQYEQAVADLRKAQATADKVLDDVKDHDDDETMTQKDLRTTAEATRDRAYRALEIAKENLRNGYLKAPFAGLIVKIVLPFSGINTIYSQSQIEIINPDTMYFEIQADQTEIKDLTVGQHVYITLDSYPEKEIEGTVENIAYTPSTGQPGTVYEVKVALNEPDTEKYRVGMTGDASFILEIREDVLYIPPKYINADKDGRFVKFKPKNNKVYVEVGIDGEKRVEIKGDISQGDMVYD